MIVGIGLSTSAAPGANPLEEAVAAEALGYDFVSVSDHPVGRQPSYDAVMLLSWIAARTHRIGIATRVLAVPFRRPAMLAKAAESLHRLSGGRLILGLGGGYSDAEIHALGAAVPTPGQKVDGLADAIAILRAAWSQESATVTGPIYSVDQLTLEPKPDTPIPIWLGTYGPRAVALTGRLADGWIPSLGYASPGELAAMLRRIRAASLDAGRPADAVRAVCNVSIAIGSRRGEAGTLAGSADAVLAQVQELAQLGFTGLNVLPTGPGDTHAFAAEILPALRDQ